MMLDCCDSGCTDGCDFGSCRMTWFSDAKTKRHFLQRIWVYLELESVSWYVVTPFAVRLVSKVSLLSGSA